MNPNRLTSPTNVDFLFFFKNFLWERSLTTVSDVSAPACTNVLWPPLRPVNVMRKNKPSTMLSFNFQSIDLPMDCTAWRFWTMRQPNGCSTPAPKSSAAKQWIEVLSAEYINHWTSKVEVGFYYIDSNVPKTQTRKLSNEPARIVDILLICKTSTFD